MAMPHTKESYITITYIEIPLAEKKPLLIRKEARYAKNIGLTPLLPLSIFLSLINNPGTVGNPGFSTIQIFYSRNCYD
jgi:hypothetical protein